MPIKGMSPKAVMHKEMHEFKHGELHSGSKKGPVVKSRKQAIAIGLSEERKAMGHKEHAASGRDGKHHDGHYNPVEHGYGFGNHHDGKTSHGMSIGGGKGAKHAHDALQQNIAGKGNASGGKGEHESKLRSSDNPRSDDKQPHGRGTGEDSHSGVESRSMEHREPHRMGRAHVEGAHGFGHGVDRRQGPLRMSGHKGAHRIGKR